MPLGVKELSNAKRTHCSWSIMFTSSILTGAYAHLLGSPKNSLMLSSGVEAPKENQTFCDCDAC